MEESKELQGLYTIFRATIYISLLLEFFMYALDPTSLDFLGGLITNIHSRLQLLSVYQFLPYSKMVTVMLVIITCIGTKNKKQLEFDSSIIGTGTVGYGFSRQMSGYICSSPS